MSEAPPQEAAVEEEVYVLTDEFVRDVRDALDAEDEAAVSALIEPLHAADLADLVELVNRSERKALVDLIAPRLDPEMLSHLDEAVRDQVVDQLEPEQIAAAVTELDTDDAVYVVEDLDPETQRAVLEAVPEEDRTQLEESLEYDEDTAGRLMQRELISVPEFWTIGQTIDFMRESEDLPDEFYEIFVVDPAHRPVGTVALNRAMRTKRPVVVSEIMNADVKTVPVEMEQDDVAHLFRQYDLLSAPVVDGSGRVIGVIMVDDIVDVIDEEAEEDILRLGGIVDDDLNAGIVRTTRSRFTWLAVNLITAIVASMVIGLFEATIDQMVALAVLMPIVASMGGNAGTQTMTIAVRSLATHELTAANAWRLFNKETLVGLANGGLFALLVGVAAFVWFGDPMLAGVIAAAMVINMLAAGVAGIAVPLALERLDIDPAVASSVFVTTITDVIGFFAFLGLAALVLL
ncbi:MAG: magnesium transporter [Minwuiales bacterium]|nr:magnesium transporter [Minwuiales bacterium]